jgi:hypothetical protein
MAQKDTLAPNAINRAAAISKAKNLFEFFKRNWPLTVTNATSLVIQ